VDRRGLGVQRWQRGTERRALTEHDLPDRRGTAPAPLAGVAVDVELAEEVARCAIWIEAIAQESTAFDRPGEDACA
jgi:hypothetical protein